MLTLGQLNVSIQAVPQRSRSTARLIDRLMPARVSVVWHQPGQTCLETTATVFRQLSDCDDEWAIRFEDDAEPCPDFWSHVLPLLSVIPPGIEFATLYNGRRVRSREPIWPPRWELRPGARFMMAQCVVVRPSLAREIAGYYPGWAAEHPEHPGGIDIALADFLRAKRLRYAQSWPGLVQHRLDLPSFLGHRPHPNRMSPSYQAIFGDAGHEH